MHVLLKGVQTYRYIASEAEDDKTNRQLHTFVVHPTIAAICAADIFDIVLKHMI